MEFAYVTTVMLWSLPFNPNKVALHDTLPDYHNPNPTPHPPQTALPIDPWDISMKLWISSFQANFSEIALMWLLLDPTHNNSTLFQAMVWCRKATNYCPGQCWPRSMWHSELTHWSRVTHICVSDLTSIGSDNGLSPGRRQAIIRTNAGILLIKNVVCEMASSFSRPQCVNGAL